MVFSAFRRESLVIETYFSLEGYPSSCGSDFLLRRRLVVSLLSPHRPTGCWSPFDEAFPSSSPFSREVFLNFFFCFSFSPLIYASSSLCSSFFFLGPSFWALYVVSLLIWGGSRFPYTTPLSSGGRSLWNVHFLSRQDSLSLFFLLVCLLHVFRSFSSPC